MIGIATVPHLRDAALMASVQKVAHYAIAAYGTAAALAGQLDLRHKSEVNQDALAA